MDGIGVIVFIVVLIVGMFVWLRRVRGVIGKDENDSVENSKSTPSNAIFCDEYILTKQDAERLVGNAPQIDDAAYTHGFYLSIEDEAAEILSKCNDIYIYLNGLTELSDAAAVSLGKHEGELIALRGLTELSDASAKSLGQYGLSLSGLTELSDAAAESLANKEPKFASWHINLDNLPASAAQILRDAGHGE